jgi:hypothetical protein
MNWQPIETAPKDGTAILLWYPDLHQKWQKGYWYDKVEIMNGVETYRIQKWLTSMGAFRYGEEPDPQPTHWMLPEPPDAQQ